MNYAALYLLKEMLENDLVFSVHLEDDELALEEIFAWLRERGFIAVNNNSEYLVTTSGFDYADSFLERYADFLASYDIFCGVDLDTKDFAVRYLADFQDQDAWRSFLSEERWEDLRIAIAEYKGLDAIEIVFMGFVYEQRFGKNNGHWCADRLTGSIWEEIQSVCNNAVRMSDLSSWRGLEDSRPELIIEDLIYRGLQLIKELG